MASGTTVAVPSNGANVPSNGANIIQIVPGLPSVALQASGAIPYPQYGAQQLGLSTYAPQQVPQRSPWERFLKAEPKVLGAVQIMIGLIHIGFGAVSLCPFPWYYFNISALGGYPFWGGIFFISSGSLCVAAGNHSNRGLVKSSVAMNIISALISLSGIILYLCELIINSFRPRYYSEYTNYYLPVAVELYPAVPSIGYGFSSVLLLFSLLEFCIAVSLAHFGCQATCCSDDQPTMIFVPYQVIRGEAMAAEPNPLPPPPTYDNTATKPQ